MKIMQLLKDRRTMVVLISLFVIGWIIGSGSVTFVEAKGFSYFSNSPEACKNCHVMNQVYEKWEAGPHHHVAVCNDCHTPHSFIGKWMTKAENGYNHSRAFTFDKDLPIVFEPKPSSVKIVNDNCVRCHDKMSVHAQGFAKGMESLQCTSCHKNPGH